MNLVVDNFNRPCLCLCIVDALVCVCVCVCVCGQDGRELLSKVFISCTLHWPDVKKRSGTMGSLNDLILLVLMCR